MRTVYVSSLLTAALLAGCASQGYQSAEKADTSLTDTKIQLIQDKVQLKGATDALNDLVYHPQADLRPQYMTFTNAVDKLEKGASDTKKSTADAMDKRAAYMAGWRTDTMQTTDTDLRDRAMQRIAETQKRYDAVNAKLADANASFGPLLDDLKAVRDYIGSDLTSNGIKSISDRATSAQNRSITVGQKIDAAVNAIDGVSGEMAPLSPATQKSDMNDMK